jgi:hypothetical protein
MAKILCTMAGMIGDNIFKIPVAYQIHKHFQQPVDIAVDHGSRCMLSLLRSLPWVDAADTSMGIHGYPMGGQPYDFGRDDEWRHQYEQVFHLGFRHFPGSNLSVDSAHQSEAPVDWSTLLTERPVPGQWQAARNLCIHTDSSHPHRSDMSLECILGVRDQLADLFEHVHIITHVRQEDYYHQLLEHPKYSLWRDEGCMEATVELLDQSLLIGTYSSMWALMAACVHGPQVVMMDTGHWMPQRRTNNELEKVIMTDDPQRLLDEVKGLLQQ